eukprot:541362_1
MFSWFGKDSNDKKDNSNNNNNLQQSIFEDNENDIKESKIESTENTMIPTIDNYPLHAAVLMKDEKSLVKHIQNLPPFDPLLPDKTRPINKRDHHGHTPLHLCVFLSWELGIDILLKAGASSTVRSRSGWSAVQECISTSQRHLLTKLFTRNMQEVREGLALRSPIIRKKLCEKDDFYVEIDWKFNSWIPFVSRFCPCDTFKIWKRGSDFRLDMSLVDFESFSWKRGHISFIFIMNPKTDKAEFYVLNHDDKTKQVTNKQKELEESKNPKDINDNIEQLLQSELVSPEIFTSKIEIEKAKSWLGYEKITEINGKKCILYELKNLIILANKRDSHVPQEVKEQRALTKQLFKSKVEASKKGEKVDFEIEAIDGMENLDLENWPCEKCGHENAINYVICEQCFSDKVRKNENDENDSNNNDSNSDMVVENSNVSEEKNNDTPASKSTSSISALFGEVKRYEYAEWIPPKVDINEYFNVDMWQKLKMDLMSNKIKKKKNVVQEVIENRKDSFKMNPSEATITTKTFKLNLFMTEHFGLSIDEILAILEAAAPQSKLAGKLKEFLEIKMPRGFPIQLELPLFHVLKATVTFQNFEHINPSDDIFEIPDDYLLVEKCEKDNINT